MDNSPAKLFLDEALKTFRSYKKLGEKAFEQLNDEEFFAQIDEESNSVAVIIKHMAGNMISRWTDFLTTDGEKPDRHRDAEFVAGEETRDEIMARWERGWRAVFAAIEPLQAEDVTRTVFIRGEAHTVVKAIDRQIAHYAYHVGQIVFLAKHLKSKDWKSLSVPRNRSAEFNAYLAEKNRKMEDSQQSYLDAPQDFIRDTKNRKS